MEKTRQQIGRRIRALRESLKMGQSEFGAILGVSNKAISNYENGDSAPSLDVLVRIVETCDTTYDQIIAGRQLAPAISITLDDDEIRLIQHYRGMPPKRQDLTRRIAEELSEAKGGTACGSSSG